jgi:serine/threonine protein kinase
MPCVIGCTGARLAADDVLQLYLERGIPLGTWREHTHPSEQQLDTFLRCLVIGLFNLHQRGILHGDLKPGNVVVVGQQLKLIDLGMTCFCASRRIHILGTCHYNAPEALAYDATYTAACDAFSLHVPPSTSWPLVPT